jgi:hypothetical protein
MADARGRGLECLEVAEDQLSLCVHFFGQVPEGVTADNVRIEGGRRIRDVQVVSVEIDRAEAVGPAALWARPVPFLTGWIELHPGDGREDFDPPATGE